MKPTLLLFEQRMVGDAVMSLPFIRAAQTRYEVHISCAPWSVPILQTALPGTQLHPWCPPWLQPQRSARLTGWLSAEFRRQRDLWRTLKPAVAASVWPDIRVHRLMQLSGAPHRVGFPVNRQNYFAHHIPWRHRQLVWGSRLGRLADRLTGSPMLSHPLQRERYEQHHLDAWRQLAQALDLPWSDQQPWITLPASTDRRRNPVWMIHPGARVPAQRWPIEKFLAVIETELLPLGATCVLIDAPEIAWPDEARRRFTVVRPKDITELMQVLASGDALLGNDTGASHIAAALGKAVVTLFFASNPDWFKPWGPRSHALYQPACPLAPCLGRCLQDRLICHDPDMEPAVRQLLRKVHAGLQTELRS